MANKNANETPKTKATEVKKEKKLYRVVIHNPELRKKDGNLS